MNFVISGPSTPHMFITERLTCAAILATLRMWMKERDKQWRFLISWEVSVSSLGHEIDRPPLHIIPMQTRAIIFLWKTLVARRWQSTCSRVSRPCLIRDNVVCNLAMDLCLAAIGGDILQIMRRPKHWIDRPMTLGWPQLQGSKFLSVVDLCWENWLKLITVLHSS